MALGGMKMYEVIPLKSIGPVLLGMPRDVVHSALGSSPDSFRKTQASPYPTDAWHNGSFQVSYSGSEPTVDYVELSQSHDFSVFIADLSVFGTPTIELVKRIEQIAPIDATDPEYGYSFIFPALELSLWRPALEDLLFSTIGVGRLGYYTNAA